MKQRNWRIIQRNQANAQRSTGPKSPEGLAKSSGNSTRHGLTSKQPVIPGEDPAEFDAHRAALIEGFKPANAVETQLVEELAAQSWRQQRAVRIETAVLAQIAADSPDPDIAIAKSFLERPEELDRLVRYMTAIERAYWRVFNKLQALQKARYEQERQAAIEKACMEAAEAKRLSKSGFVSQSAETPVVALAPEPLRAAAAGQTFFDFAVNS